MKKIMLSVALITIAMNGYSQSVTNSVCDSTLVYITKQLDNIEFGINGKNRFKLYPTENVYTFLRLDTATGRVANLGQNVLWHMSRCCTFLLRSVYKGHF